jgi:hypothetical protein
MFREQLSELSEKDETMIEFNRTDLLENPAFTTPNPYLKESSIGVVFKTPVSNKMSDLEVNDEFLYKADVYRILKKDFEKARVDDYVVFLCKKLDS